MTGRVLRKPSVQLIETLTSNLVYYRHLRQISQEELADICGLHRTYIGSVERGERNVTLSTLEIISSALGITVIQLLTPLAKTDDKSSH